jgi:hypothetical protein
LKTAAEKATLTPMHSSSGHPLCQIRTEILRAVKLCAPGLELLGRTTFDADPRDSNAVAHWRDAVFLPFLSSAIHEATTAANVGCRELLMIDASLDSRLAGPLAQASRASGRIVAAALRAPDSAPALKKFLAAVDDGTTPGHMAVIFAARAGVFHFPARVVAGAFVLLEMRSAPLDTAWATVQACLEALPPANSSLRAA